MDTLAKLAEEGEGGCGQFRQWDIERGFRSFLARNLRVRYYSIFARSYVEKGERCKINPPNSLGKSA